MWHFFLQKRHEQKRHASVLVLAFMSLALSTNILNAAIKEKIHVVFTAEDLGRLEPCGCSSGQLGGLSRRHTWLDHFKAENPGTFILLSNGDVIKDMGRQDEIKFMTLVQAMNEMGYHAMNLGEKELHFGPDYLKGLSQSAGFSFLSANLSSPEGEALFPPLLRRKAVFFNHPYVIDIIGVIDPEWVDLDAAFRVKGIKESLKPLVSAEEKNCILRVVLYHGKDDAAARWAEKFPGVDLWIAGHEKEESLHLPGEHTVAALAKEGKYIGVASFEFDADLKKCSFPEIHFYDLNDKITDSNTIKNLLSGYETELKNEKLAEEEGARWEAGGLEFTGSQACAACHASAYRAWTQSRHPHAFEDLREKNKSFDPDCLVCHTTGFKYKGGFRSQDMTPHLAEVGCETCHGMGSLHIQNPGLHPMKKPGRETCVTCHDFENSPHFEFETYWEKIKHS